MSILACDFDGTIVEHEFPKIGKIKPHCKDIIERLREKGHKIIIWTCRCDDELGPYLTEMKEWLDKNKIEYDAINTNLSKDFAPVPKIYFDVCIDDRNLFMLQPVNWIWIEMKLIQLGFL